jgi:hypothetical protein
MVAKNYVKQTGTLGAKLAVGWLVVAGICSMSAQAQTSIEQQVVNITTADQTQTIFNSATNPADQITVLELLPGVVNRFQVSPATSMPTWLNNILTQGMNSSNSDVVNAAISQAGSLHAVSLATNLTSIFSKSGNSFTRVRVVRALGDMASSNAIPFLKSIIDAYVLCPETDEAVISARKLCAAALVSDISAYCSNLNSRIVSGEFNVPNTKTLASPEESLMIAKGSLQAIVNGTCGL